MYHVLLLLQEIDNHVYKNICENNCKFLVAYNYPFNLKKLWNKRYKYSKWRVMDYAMRPLKLLHLPIHLEINILIAGLRPADGGLEPTGGKGWI